ncbi:MAG: hypothetical protein ACFBSG_03305 [Leptolyngbyaceae cyanobacterium]
MSNPTPSAGITDADLDAALPEGPGASFTFLYYFLTAGTITGLFAARLFGVGLATPLPTEVAIAGGLTGGLLGVWFNRSQTLTIPFTHQKRFRQRLETTLQTMGYALDATEGTLSRYQKPNASRLFAGDIYVQWRSQSVVLVSRASNIRALAKRLPAA